MAEGKKAFIVYTDWIKYTDIMTIEQKGIWIDWCLKYCNDLSPELPEEPMAKMLCVMCKDILKRDLKKYEEKKERFMKIGKQYQNNDIEIEEKTTPKSEAIMKPKSECVNSNKLIVNSNKCVSNDTLNNACACEEAQISNLEGLIRELEQLYGRCLTNMEQAQIDLLSKKYDSKFILTELKDNLDKTNPIAYVSKKLQNKAKVEDDFEENEWLKGFYERNR